MAGRGPAPKPAHLRARTNLKAGANVIAAPSPASVDVPPLVHPNGEVWHPLTLMAWQEFFESAMATQWLPTDITALVMLAVCYDKFYQTGNIDYLKEIRLQRQYFGLTPLDRSRLQWEVSRAEESEQKQQRRQHGPARRTGTRDPRDVLRAVK